MSDVRPWLPKEALADGKLEAAISQTAAHWASLWFRDPKAMTIKRARLSSATKITSEAISWESTCAQYVFAIDRVWLMRLANAILQLQANKKRTARDTAILEAFGRDAARDLAEKQAHLFAAEAGLVDCRSNPNEGDLHFTLSMGAGAPLFSVYVNPGLAIAGRKALAPAYDDHSPIASRREALARQPIALAARLGQSRLPLDAIGTLQPGDTLVLDRPRNARADLIVNGTRTHNGAWSWNENAAQFELELSTRP